MIQTIRRLRRQWNPGKGRLWENARFILADVPLNRETVAKCLPLGMKPADPCLGTFFIVDYTRTSFTVPYREAALLAHVQTPFGRGVHCPWMVVDDDTALIYGRELLGYPKKKGEFEFEEEGPDLKASVSRRGVKVLSLSARRGERQFSPGPVMSRKTFNVGGLGQFFLLNPIWLFRPREVIHESYAAQVTVTIADAPLDPIFPWVAGDAVSGRLAAIDIIGSWYMLPVWLAGPRWLSHVFTLRFR